MGTRPPATGALRRLLRALRRRLRAPRFIVCELAAIALAGALSTVVPQLGEASAVDLARFQTEHPLTASVASALDVDQVVRSWWFLGLVGLAGVSLVIVQVDQWRVAWRLWRRPLTAAGFRNAPFRLELERPASGGAGVRAMFQTRGRVGLLGSPLFHLGLVLVVVAGLLRMLFSQSAVVDLFEGERLPPEPAAYATQWLGPLAEPFSLPVGLTFERLLLERYPTGRLKSLEARVRLEGGDGPEAVRLSVNTSEAVGGERLHLAGEYGPAALFELRRRGQSRRVAVLLRPARGEDYEAVSAVAGGFWLRLRGRIGGDGSLPGSLETRVLAGGALLYVGRLAEGQMVKLGPEIRLVLHDIRFWGQLRGNHDRAMWLAYAGMTVAVLGALLIFSVSKIDTAVIVTPTGEGTERVLVALRAQRFAPLYRERFERLVREQGGVCDSGGLPREARRA